MKKLLSILLFFVCANVFGQISEDFNSLAQWQGDLAKFELLNGQLHLKDASATSPAYLTIASEISLEATWEFWAKMSFSPSGSNKLQVALIADRANISGDFNGYFLSIGEDGSSDAIELYKKTGALNTKLARGGEARFANQLDSFLVKVSRDANHLWTVSTNTGAGFVQEFQVVDSSYKQSKFFGFKPIYTSTRSSAFYFDKLRINGKTFVDNQAPKLLTSSLLDNKSIRLGFDEDILESSIDLQTVSVNGILAETFSINGSEVIFQFPVFESDINLSFKALGIKDSSGNEITEINQNFTFHQNQLWDVLISELMPDPSDPVALPEAEFVELYNNSKVPLNLKNWSLCDPSKCVLLPDFTLDSATYVIVTAAEFSSEFSVFGELIGLASIPSLNNSGDEIWIKDSTGLIIHQMKYDLKSYQNTDKDEGGYSLELHDFDKICLGNSLYKASDDISGGTPGKQNSVFGTYVYMSPNASLSQISRDSVKVKLSSILSAEDVSNNFLLDGNGISSVKMDTANLLLCLYFDSPINRNQEYTLQIQGMSDCLGNSLDTNFTIFIAKDPEIKQLVISEVLFNPPSGAFDFIEVYVNASNKLSTNDLFLVSLNTATSEEISRKLLPPNLILDAQSYYVLTKDKADLLNRYPDADPNQVIEMDIPSMNDDEGRVALFFGANQNLDEVYYNEKFHAVFLTDEEGVSLERIDLQSQAIDANNWFSASQSTGFASPTKENSAKTYEQEANFTLSSDRISPDGDGFEDFTTLVYKELDAGTLLNLKLFDRSGYMLQEYYQNYSIAGSGSLIIDASKNGTNVLTPGIYILLLETFDTQGNTFQKKLTLTVNSRF